MYTYLRVMVRVFIQTNMRTYIHTFIHITGRTYITTLIHACMNAFHTLTLYVFAFYNSYAFCVKLTIVKLHYVEKKLPKSRNILIEIIKMISSISLDNVGSLFGYAISGIVKNEYFFLKR